VQGKRSHPQRWKIGHYLGKNFEDLGELYSYIHIEVSSFYVAITSKSFAETILPFFFASDELKIFQI